MAGPSTKAVHGGETPDQDGSVVTGVAASTTFRYPEKRDGSPSDYIYTRYANPTLAAVEQKLAALDGADGAFVFASGLGAETAILHAFLRGGDKIAVQRGAYGGTVALVQNQFVPLGVKMHRFDAADPDGPELPGTTSVVWIESISNPLLRVADIEAWADVAHGLGAKLVVDATFASPALQRPLELGADLVLHSGTKYLNGHADVTAGVIAFREDDREALWQRRRDLGATLDPMAAYLLGRGVKTLPLRMEAHCAASLRLAHELADHDAVEAVHHPGLRSHPDHALAGRILEGYGGMLTLDLGDLKTAQRFRRRLRIITPAASLGGVESLVSLPIETSHAYATEEERAADGITDGLVRISVGIEDPVDLLADIEHALAR